MGNRANITVSQFPKQGTFLNRRVRVLFHYGAGGETTGTVVRDDAEDPFDMIIRLDDGRFIRGCECQYQELD